MVRRLRRRAISVRRIEIELLTLRVEIAIVCITALGISALCLGHNGTILASIVGAIAGLSGYQIGKRAS